MKTTGIGTEEIMTDTKSQTQAEAQVVTQIAPAKMTLAEVRAKLDGKTGRRFWKNLDELAETSAFQELMQEEFPRQAGAGEWVDPVSRRGFLKVMGASFALAGLAGCTKQPDEPIYPYVKQPEDLILGKPMYFATAYPFPTGAIPVLIKSDSFRPIKVDGNPEHPMSKGRSDAMTQATLLDLYDPDRSQRVRLRGQGSSYGDFQKAFQDAANKSSGGQGIYFLSETITSPTLAAQWKAGAGEVSRRRSWSSGSRSIRTLRALPRRRPSEATPTRSTSLRTRTLFSRSMLTSWAALLIRASCRWLPPMPSGTVTKKARR